jgi:hypothetical protein
MNRGPSLNGAYRKHERAMKHHSDLMEVFDAYIAKNVEIEAQPRKGDGEAGSRYSEIKVTDAYGGFEVYIGDCVQNLRSALDYLVWELAYLAQGKPPRQLTQFPISTTAKRYFEVGRGQVSPLLGEHRRFIRKIQPYQSESPRSHPLALLNRLSNQDKHRLLHVLAAHVRTISERPDAGPKPKTIVLPLAYKTIPSILHAIDPEVGVIGWISLEFDGEGRSPVFETLTDLIVEVRRILDWFEPVVR